MTETQWGEEVEEQQVTVKTGVPGWVWGCGGGCLLLVLLGVVLIGLMVNEVKKLADPELARQKAEQVLIPRETWPETLEVKGGGGFLGQAQYHMLSTDGVWYAILFDYSPGQSAAAGQLLDPDSQANRGILGYGEIRDAEEGTTTVQGREVRILRFFPWVPDGAEAQGEVGPSLRVDLTIEGENSRILQLIRSSSGEPVTDEELVEFLEPFDVWATEPPSKPSVIEEPTEALEALEQG